MRVLIAEDQLTDRLVLHAAVRRLGHECIAAEDGVQALDLFATQAPDVVISDLRMPNMDGLELCRRIRAATPSTHIPFFFTTGLLEREHVLAGVEAGADDYLAKPIELAEVRARLIAARWLKRVEDERRATREGPLKAIVERLGELRARLDSGVVTHRDAVSRELAQIQQLASEFAGG
jgi:CheY-like chemotaxis protein